MTGQQSRPKNTVRAPGWDQRRRAAALCLALAAITFAVFGQTARHEFIGADNPEYVYENRFFVVFSPCITCGFDLMFCQARV
jgi:hypothetical protein